MNRRLLLAVVSALVALLAGVLAGAPVSVAATTTSPLPADPKAHGYVGLCDEDGHNVTGGSINAKPFVWKAVASTPPPAAYQGRGQNAVLNVYQPRPQVPAGEWSGGSLTAATFYTTPRLPAVQATYQDLSLSQFTQNFPPMVDGLYVLRIYFGRANYGLYSATYPTTTIQVTGTTWHVVSGGTVDCGASKGESNEQVMGVVSKSDTTPRRPSASEQTASAGHSGAITAPVGSGGAASGSGSTGSGGSGAVPGSGMSPTAASAHSSGGSMVWLVWLLVGVVFVLGAALFLVSRSRRPVT